MDNLYKNQSLIYKYILYVVAVGFIVFFFPKGGKFKYEFQKGKPWQFENLYAPFDFSIKKTDQEVAEEKRQISENQLPYFRYNQQIVDEVYSQFNTKFDSQWSESNLPKRSITYLRNISKTILDSLYKPGILEKSGGLKGHSFMFLIRNNEAVKVPISEFHRVTTADEYIKTVLKEKNLQMYESEFQKLFLI